MTGSGKTTLAKLLADDYHRRGGALAIYDPYHGTWPAARHFRSLDALKNYMQRQHGLLVIIDESGWKLDRWAEDHNWFATQARHRSHSVIFICQGYKTLSTTIRDQCRRIWCLPQKWSRMEAIAEEVNAPWPLPAIPELPADTFFAWRIDVQSPMSRCRAYTFRRGEPIREKLDVSAAVRYDQTA